jgi:copper(I)-binding protein
MRPSLFAPLLAAFLLGAGAACAAGIEVKDAWIRSTPPGAPTAAGYATIVNHGFTSDRLTGATTRVAASVEMHHMTSSGGVMRMRPIQGGVAMAGSGTIRFTPTGDHLMLVGLKGPLKAGTHVKVTLQFRRAGSLAADFTVRDAAPAGGMAGMHM